MEALEQKIVELTRELEVIEGEGDRLSSEAKKWAEKRDSIHEQIKGLQTEVSHLKGKRDALNEGVRELKSLRETAREERREKNAQIQELKGRLEILMGKKPPRSLHKIKQEIENIEWKIQTTHLTLEEERSLIDQVRPLEAQLLAQKQIQRVKDNILKLQTEGKALETQARLYHEKLLRLAEQSQKFHKKMIEDLNRIRDLRAEADVAHQKCVHAKEQAEDLRQRHAELWQQIRLLKQKLHQAEEEKQEKRRLEFRREMTERAVEKLKRGEKLTWEEFKALTEQGSL